VRLAYLGAAAVVTLVVAVALRETMLFPMLAGLAALLLLAAGILGLRVGLSRSSKWVLAERLFCTVGVWLGLLRLGFSSGFHVLGGAGVDPSALALTFGAPGALFIVGMWCAWLRRLEERAHAARAGDEGYWQPAPLALGRALSAILALTLLAGVARGGAGRVSLSAALLLCSGGAFALMKGLPRALPSYVGQVSLLLGHAVACWLVAPLFFALPWLLTAVDSELDVEQSTGTARFLEMCAAFGTLGLRLWLLRPLDYLTGPGPTPNAS
jgi:hypothetical protein